MSAGAPDVSPLWHAVGIAGGVIFYGRFYAQWIASERAGRSVLPVLFWYMSSVGSVLLMAFSVATRSPLGALGMNFNLIPYGRNLLHIWRENGTLTPLRQRLVNVAMILVGIVAMGLLLYVWIGEYEHNQKQSEAVARQAWVWLAVGGLGQVLFASRSAIQWFETERQRRSVVPRSFWYLSLAASLLQAATFLQRREWVFCFGLLATSLIYARNIWLVRRGNAAQGAQA